MSPAVDVVVAGGGPSGTALAAALAERGLSTLLLEPVPGRAWRATYGAWADELTRGDGTGPGSAAAAALALPGVLRWPEVVVADDEGERALPREYVRLDTAGLQQALGARAAAAGVRVEPGTAAAVEHHRAASTVTLRDGRALTTALVVDAAGHHGALVRRPATGRPAAVQAAYGLVADFAVPPVASGRAVLMDLSAAHLPVQERAVDPTFLYAMPLGGDRWFVEETSLARRPALPTAVLARRLALRLAAAGAPPREQSDVEHVRIPMDTPLPYAGQRVLAVGAAASTVHPATGYLLAAALRATPGLADAVAGGLGAAGGGPERAAALGWAALWPADRVRVRRVHEFGLEALLGMDGPTTRAFFRAFFSCRAGDWSDYLSGRQSLPGTLAFMTRLYAAAPPAVRRHLRGSALGPRGLLLARAASGSLPAAPAAPGAAA